MVDLSFCTPKVVRLPFEVSHRIAIRLLKSVPRMLPVLGDVNIGPWCGVERTYVVLVICCFGTASSLCLCGVGIALFSMFSILDLNECLPKHLLQ